MLDASIATWDAEGPNTAIVHAESGLDWQEF